MHNPDMNLFKSKIMYLTYAFLGTFIILMSMYLINKQNHIDNHIQDLYPSTNDQIKYQSEWQKEFYFDRIKKFRNNPIGFNKIVLLGNSITQSGGDWNKRLYANNIINRGISGDYTEGIINRLDEIIYYKPTAVFLLIGVNDIFKDNSNNPEINPSYVARNIIKIADKIKNGSPTTLVFIQTILPINNQLYMEMKKVDYNFLKSDYHPSINEQINNINSILINNKKHNIIELHIFFKNKEGVLNSSFSTDGVHLNQEGYRVWSEAIAPIVMSLNK